MLLAESKMRGRCLGARLHVRVANAGRRLAPQGSERHTLESPATWLLVVGMKLTWKEERKGQTTDGRRLELGEDLSERADDQGRRSFRGPLPESRWRRAIVTGYPKPASLVCGSETSQRSGKFGHRGDVSNPADVPSYRAPNPWRLGPLPLPSLAQRPWLSLYAPGDLPDDVMPPPPLSLSRRPNIARQLSP